MSCTAAQEHPHCSCFVRPAGAGHNGTQQLEEPWWRDRRISSEEAHAIFQQRVQTYGPTGEVEKSGKFCRPTFCFGVKVAWQERGPPLPADQLGLLLPIMKSKAGSSSLHANQLALLELSGTAARKPLLPTCTHQLETLLGWAAQARKALQHNVAFLALSADQLGLLAIFNRIRSEGEAAAALEAWAFLRRQRRGLGPRPLATWAAASATALRERSPRVSLDEVYGLDRFFQASMGSGFHSLAGILDAAGRDACRAAA